MLLPGRASRQLDLWRLLIPNIDEEATLGSPLLGSLHERFSGILNGLRGRLLEEGWGVALLAPAGKLVYNS